MDGSRPKKNNETDSSQLGAARFNCGGRPAAAGENSIKWFALRDRRLKFLCRVLDHYTPFPLGPGGSSPRFHWKFLSSAARFFSLSVVPFTWCQLVLPHRSLRRLIGFSVHFWSGTPSRNRFVSFCVCVCVLHSQSVCGLAGVELHRWSSTPPRQAVLGRPQTWGLRKTTMDGERIESKSVALRLLLRVQVVDELVALVDDRHQLLEQQLLAQLLRLRLLPICNRFPNGRNKKRTESVNQWCRPTSNLGKNFWVWLQSSQIWKKN